MSSEREQFLARVRQAVADGNRAGAPPLPDRAGVGYQGAGPDPLARFCAELTAAGGHAHVVADAAEAVARVLELVRARSVRRALLGAGPVVEALPLADALTAAGIEVLPVSAGRAAFFAADVGISGVDYLIAETGSLALLSAPDQPRSLSLLPPLHVAVAARSQDCPLAFP
jgi:L-lactate utilization protein LutC